MDIKDLNKSQLILLAVLLSFVTSIATGITTVTLIQQAPSSVTVPVNRVIRQTIEKIEQVEGKTTVQTVVVKEEDLVVDAIAKNKSVVFDVIKQGSSEPIEVSAGNGFVVSEDGIVAVAASAMSGGGPYFLKNDSGKFKAELLPIAEGSRVAFLRIGESLDIESELAFSVPTFGDLNAMKRGQRIIVLGDSTTFAIFEGSRDIALDVANKNTGGLVLNLDGDVLGMALSGPGVSFVSINTITEALEKLSL